MSLFEGGVAVITGGASGIGRAAATLFAERGVKLCLFDHNADALAATVPRKNTGPRLLVSRMRMVHEGDAWKMVGYAVQ